MFLAFCTNARTAFCVSGNVREASRRRGAGWRMPLHLREQNQRKLIQIMPGDFQHFIKSQACKSYALFCELADMKKSQKITFTTALVGGEAAAPTGV